MSHRMVLGAVGFAATMSLAACADQEYSQRNVVLGPAHSAALSGATYVAPREAAFTVIHFAFDSESLTDEFGHE